ncbi:hypothetical protein PtrSN002B_008619 [Pyrenophora tritici-repentis]|uniref:Uncharacterized protein n=2 Tax=Pyrenophora tritici-repentis TaxID=45151 RepID=A0A2W1E957_9PLEO|nr:uncharacterized protein PTRG_11447 [Pyrenophora tritici-repentis Pt-1C-BFP]KAA8624469.1 hypothetical protein PtrV1_00149 [Pyrenophora tritici-repentis]EDU44497.1 hypothetical protein PTRG_11447 [Pyrenophora tritici-repentis Pt-1C-BFP]KAF7452873.1 hypothetical protein A1F99_001310 [Pyrenophora tritici-repentis]KAG9377679.1 hypothetical protein A1F94_012082 [Pyrenophora tritici-repentis]KAI0576997.1 hypothetical protein Alg215_07161 [Pyrenophora tritici-repentis]
MHLSTLLPITLLAASAAAYPTCEPAGQYLPGVPAPDSEPGKWIPGVPAPDTPTSVSAAPSSQICERMCDDEPSECQAGWVSTQVGTCWTCCEASTTEDSSEDPYPLPSPVPDESTPKICERTCFDGPTECQTGWVSEQIGSCWACCEADGSEDPYPMPSPIPDDNEDPYPMPSPVPNDPATYDKVCERTCESEQGECQDGWVSTQLGTCWACCET